MEPPTAAAPPAPHQNVFRRNAVAIGFLAPAAVLLVVWIVYPTVYTVYRSFYGRDGSNFVGLDNYKTIFSPLSTSGNPLFKSIVNSFIWILIAPAVVTALGLIFAVLTERIRWAVAFKTVVFMPMAISLFATGVIWHVMYIKDPNQGAVNAGIAAVRSWFTTSGELQSANPSTPTLTGNSQSGFVLKKPLAAGGTADIGLTAIPPDQVPGGAKQAVQPATKQGAITGIVWRDFSPGGGTPGKVEQGELGIPGAKVDLLDSSGKQVASASTSDDGSFVFDNVSGSGLNVKLDKSTFGAPYGGVSWLGSTLITPSIIIAYIWVWAGFAMVVIAAGLAAISREVLEAARTDGATEWQVFRRITVPMLAPVLSVVFVTMLINVLKVFDIIISIAPGSTQSDAAVIAVQMWRQSFGGSNNFGLGSAIAVLLFILVVPVLLLNVRRFRREV